MRVSSWKPPEIRELAHVWAGSARGPNRLAVVVIGLLIAVAPAVISSYLTLQLALIGIFAVGAFGMVVLTGHGGQFNLGFAGLMALGAYTAAVLQQHGVGLGVALLAAVFMGIVAGLLLGVFAFWLSAFAMAIVTYGFGIFVEQGVRALPSLTGGLSGTDLPPLSLSTLYYVTWGCAALAALIAWGIMRGWVGRWLRAVRDNAIAAEQLGLPVGRTKLTAYVITSPFAAFTGALYGEALKYISPSAFTLTLSLAFLVIVIVGGVTSLWGGLLGALLWVAVPELTSSVTGLYPILFGALTVAVLLIVPGGAVDLPRAIRRWARQARRIPPDLPSDAETLRSESVAAR